MAFRRPTVRVKLTALYGMVLLLSGAIVLTGLYVVMAGTLGARLGRALGVSVPATPPVPATSGSPPNFAAASANETLRALLLYSAVGLVVLGVLSAAAGWWLAGRVLKPVHRITATARRLSSENLHERIALAGPHDELTELAATFDMMLDRLQRSFESQRRFIANVSHELRTPLTIQRAAIQIGLNDPDPGRAAEVREQMLVANRRTEQLIDSLLVLARGDRGLENRSPVPFGAVVSEVVEQHASHAAARAITMDIAVEPIEVLGDRVLLTQLVVNLVSNAMHHNTDGGHITIRLDRHGLHVANTGPMLDPNTLSSLFEPFRRGPRRAEPADGGVGLGLAIVHSIVRAHDGEVTAEARPDGGLTVHVRLPGR